MLFDDTKSCWFSFETNTNIEIRYCVRFWAKTVKYNGELVFRYVSWTFDVQYNRTANIGTTKILSY